jgi:hypothetical protein
MPRRPARMMFPFPLLLCAIAACAPPQQQQAARPHVDINAARIEAMKLDVVERLAQCESGGQSIYSPGGLYVGPMQFHRGTVIAYYRTLYGQQISTREAVEIAMDKPRATQLARDIIFTSGNKARDWPACSRKLGTNAEVDRILAMERM